MIGDIFCTKILYAVRSKDGRSTKNLEEGLRCHHPKRYCCEPSIGQIQVCLTVSQMDTQFSDRTECIENLSNQHELGRVELNHLRGIAEQLGTLRIRSRISTDTNEDLDCYSQ